MNTELYHAVKKGKPRNDHKYIKREWKGNKWVYYYDLPSAQNKSVMQQPKAKQKSANKPTNKQASTLKQNIDKGKNTVKSILSSSTNASGKKPEVIKQRMTEAKQLIESKVFGRKQEISGSVVRNDPANAVKKDDNVKTVNNTSKSENKNDDVIIDKTRNNKTAIDKKQAEADKRNEEFKKRQEERKAKLEAEKEAKKEAAEKEKKAAEDKAKKEYEDAQNAERNGIRKAELEKALETLTTESTWFKTYNPLPDLDLKSEPTTIDEDMSVINPKYGADEDNLYNQNCAVCTLAYDLRRRGYDVMASSEEVTMANGTAGLSMREIASCYEGGEFVSMKDIARDNEEISGELKDAIKSKDGVKMGEYMDKELLRHGEGARGHIVFHWTGGGGHDIAWEVENGKVVYRDCQTNNKIDIKEYSAYSEEMLYMRTDNLKMSKKAMKYIRNRKDGQ